MQIGSENKNQVNIRDIILRINKGEIINFYDVDKLDEDEKKHVYNIGKNYIFLNYLIYQAH